MLRSVIGVAAGAALLLVAGVGPASAMPDNVALKAHVPFAFEVDGQTFPAGNYRIQPAGFNEPNVIEIRNTNCNGPDKFFLTVPRKESPSLQHSEMVFDKVGNQRFLRSILIEGESGASVLAMRTEVQAVRAEYGIPAASRG
jgi:hypothetical protein